MYGVWLLPAVLAPLIVRKPGAGAVRRAHRRDRLRAARLRLGHPRAASTACCRAWPARPGSPPSATAASAGRRRCSRPLLRRRHGRACSTWSTTTPTGPAGWKLDLPASSSWSAPTVVAGLGGLALRAGPGAPAARCRRSPPAAPGSDHAPAPPVPARSPAGRLTGWALPVREPARLGAARRRPGRRARRAGAAHRRLRRRASPRCCTRWPGCSGPDTGEAEQAGG